MGDTKKSDSTLSWIFNVAVVAVAVNVGWQLLLDPLFFPVFHGAQNEVAQASILFMKDWFGWLPYHLGLTGEGGLFKPILEFILSDQLTTIRGPGLETFYNPANALSLDGL